MPTATTAPKKLYSIDDLARIQRDADREHVERSVARIKVGLPAIRNPASKEVAFRTVQLADAYMEAGLVEEAATLVYSIQCNLNGHRDDVLEFLRELAT